MLNHRIAILVHSLFWIMHSVAIVLFLAPLGQPGAWGVGADKVVHFVLFAVLGLLTYVVLKGRWWTTALGLMGYALLIEYAQDLMQVGRSFEWQDWFVGVAAILLSGVVYRLFLVK